MVFFGAFRNGAELARLSPFSKSPPCSRFWGVVISAVYMLRAYRAIFMGPIPESSGLERVTDLVRRAAVPIDSARRGHALVGFFPQFLRADPAPDLHDSHFTPTNR